MNYLYNIKQNIIVEIQDEDILDKLYYLEYRIPTKKDIDNNKNIKLPNDFIDDIKIYISSLEYKIPLYDIYTENLYLINNYNVYHRMLYQHYRFPDKLLLNNLKKIIQDQDQNKLQDNITNINYKRKIRKAELIISFMNNFDLNVLEKTLHTVIYKYSIDIGKEIISCKRPSFNKYIFSSKPYYTHSEIINMALNMNLIKVSNKNIINKKFKDNVDLINNLCNQVSNNDITFDIILSHQKHIIKNDALGLIQYYTIQGSYFINAYLRGLAPYKSKNIVLENLIIAMNNLCITAPAFDKSYILYRFIKTDEFIKQYNIGDIYEEQGFLSTTRDPFYRTDMYEFGFILIKIKIPADIIGVALCLETISHFPKEQEIIFPPNSKFKLINKDDKCIYYHTKPELSSQVKTRYEFEWINNSHDKTNEINNILYNNLPSEQIKEINFINEYNAVHNIKENIKLFTQNYLNNQSQFLCKIGNKQFTHIAEHYDSTSAYKNFYAIKNMRDGFSIYCIYEYYLLYFIEIGETENGNEMHVNYYVKYNTLDKENIINNNDFLIFVSSIAYYFNISSVAVYTEYKPCIYNIINNDIKRFNTDINNNSNNNTNNDKNINTINDDIYIKNKNITNYSGNYCIDHYNYIKTNKQRFTTDKISKIELKPLFAYSDFDYLKEIEPSVLALDNNDEIGQLYNKIYKLEYPNSNLAEFIIWIIENKCYLLEYLIPKLNEIYGDNNPFNNDTYILYPITFLYNRNIIKSFTALIIDDIYKPVNKITIQKNDYRLETNRLKVNYNKL